MATYLQGVTDYIPQIQPFTPDYNFYSGALDFKQGKYDANRKQLSNLYGSLLNAPLTRDDNVASREKFFKTIEQDIQKMATVDLSLEQNLDVATDVFNQLIDNNNIVKDMVWSRNFQNQSQIRDNFKNCVDPEKCGGAWWEGGDTHLNLQREDFRNATKEEAMAISMPEYVAYQDVTKKAMALAKEADLNVSIDQNTGQWITTTKNGPLVQEPLKNLFMGVIGKDPKVMQYYLAKSEVDRKSFMHQNQEQYGSLEAAEQAYMSERIPVLEKMIYGDEAELEDKVNTNQAKTDKINKKLERSVPRDRTRLEEIRDDFQTRQGGYDASHEMAKESKGQVEIAQRNQQWSPSQFDRTMAALELGTDINNAAQTLAYKDYEYKMKENPYAVEAVKMKNRMFMEEYKHRNRLELAEHKHILKQAAIQASAMGGPEHNMPTSVTEIAGSTAGSNAEQTSYAHLNRGFDQYADERNGMRKDVSANEKAIISDVYMRTSKAAQNGDVQAKEDMVELAQNYLYAKAKGAKNIGHKGTSGGEGLTDAGRSENNTHAAYEKELRNAKTLDQKYQAIKGMNLDLDGIAGSQADIIYESAVTGMLKPNAQGTKGIRDYLEPTRIAAKDMVYNIAAKGEALGQMDEWYAKESSEVASKARALAKYGDKWADAFEAYIDDKGHVRDQGDFVAEMKKMGYSANSATEMYRGDQRKDWGSPDKWGDASYNVAAMFVDAVGTTIAGVFGEVSNAFEWLLPNIGDDSPEGIAAGSGAGPEWGYGFGGPGKKGWTNWDYDSPRDVANWGGAGGTEWGIGNDDKAMADAGLHDMWKRAFSELGTPDSDRAWLGSTGAGGVAAMGQNYQVVDPAAYRSISTMGTMGTLKDAINSEAGVFDIGGFKSGVPNNNAEVEQIGKLLYQDMLTMKKGTSRPLLNVTYSDVAGGNADMMGINIVANQSWVNKYKGSAKEKGPTRDYMSALTTEGMTVYVPKNQTTNVFTEGSKDSSLEKLMKWTGKIDMDYAPDYAKDFKIESDPTTGSYKASGMFNTGMDENGNPEWDYLENHHGFSSDVNDLVAQYDKLIHEVKGLNVAVEKKWLLNEMNKIN